MIPWSDVPGLRGAEQAQLFEYMRVRSDDLTPRDERRVAADAPPGIRARVLEVWPDVGSDEGDAA